MLRNEEKLKFFTLEFFSQRFVVVVSKSDKVHLFVTMPFSVESCDINLCTQNSGGHTDEVSSHQKAPTLSLPQQLALLHETT